MLKLLCPSQLAAGFDFIFLFVLIVLYYYDFVSSTLRFSLTCKVL